MQGRKRRTRRPGLPRRTGGGGASGSPQGPAFSLLQFTSLFYNIYLQLIFALEQGPPPPIPFVSWKLILGPTECLSCS